MSEKTVKATKEGRTVETLYDFGDTLDEMTQKFGEEVVRSNAEQSITVNLQSMIRRMIQAGKTDEEIQAKVAEHVPGKGGEKADPVEKFKAKWSNLSKEEREKLLDELKQMDAA